MSLALLCLLIVQLFTVSLVFRLDNNLDIFRDELRVRIDSVWREVRDQRAQTAAPAGRPQNATPD